MKETKKSAKKKDVYLVNEAAKVLGFKRASGSFYIMLEKLKLPARYMLKEGTTGMRKIRVFSDDDLREMLRYRQSYLSLNMYC